MGAKTPAGRFLVPDRPSAPTARSGLPPARRSVTDPRSASVNTASREGVLAPQDQHDIATRYFAEHRAFRGAGAEARGAGDVRNDVECGLQCRRRRHETQVNVTG